MDISLSLLMLQEVSIKSSPDIISVVHFAFLLNAESLTGNRKFVLKLDSLESTSLFSPTTL
jgi:hypothetical protein